MTDDQLDATSRALLSGLRELRQLEDEKRTEARSTGRFHDLAEEVSEKARDVFELAHREEAVGSSDSPLPEERAEQSPGDWSGERAG